ncbi:hypothetical protein RDI58_028765 [Solanum bulbocastanum]|uniref:Uncharacterized protein n=1 Tax=Solanum bulbocastanum TaxID=147425 RepID=A0AAN8STA7_SOLBU
MATMKSGNNSYTPAIVAPYAFTKTDADYCKDC